MTSQEITEILSYTSMWGIVIPIIVGIINWKLLDKPLKIILAYLICLFAGTITGFIQTYLKVQNNFWVFSVLFGIEAFFAGWFYSEVLKPKKIRFYILGLGFLLNVYIIIEILYLSNSFLKSISGKSSILILIVDILWGIVFIYQIITNPKVSTLSKNSHFWIAIGWLFGAMIGLFMVIYAESLWNYSKKLYIMVSNLSNIITMIQYILFAYAFYLKQRILGKSLRNT